MMRLCLRPIPICPDALRYAVIKARHFLFLAHPTEMQAPNFDGENASKHVADIAEILAAGLIRLSARKSSGKRTESGESSLDFTAIKSGHPSLVPCGGSDG
jgi:hypothetical protein